MSSSGYFAGALSGLLLGLAPLTSHAADYAVLIDADNQPGTGCQVSLPGQSAPVDGIEVRLTARVDTATDPGTVQDLRVESCTEGSLEAAQALDAGYPVGLDLGTGGADVIELAGPLDLVRHGPDPVRLHFSADDGSGSDRLSTVTGQPGDGPILFHLPFAIPALGAAGLAVLALVLLAAARRRGSLPPAVLGLVSLAGSAVAAGFALDGQTGDWAGEPVAGTDAAGDATNGLSQLDLRRAWAGHENERFFFRLDVANLDNTPPVAVADGYSVDEDGLLSEPAPGLLANDNDPDGDALDAVAATGTSAEGAAFQVMADGSFDYDPAGSASLQALGAGDTLDDSFDYQATDGSDAATATVTVSITGANDDPVPANDTLGVDEDSSGNALDVLANDTDPESDALTITAVGAPDQGGSVNINGSGDGLLYSPAGDFAGTETFTYTVDDGNGGSATATVSVTVTNLQDPPSAADDSVTVDEDSTGNALAVLANDTDPDPGDTLTITAVGTPDQGGSVSINGAGDSLLYDPAADFAGTETFTYTIGDGNGGSDTATVTVTVTEVNDAPTAEADAFSTDEDTPAGGNVLDDNGNGADSDPESDPLTVTAFDATSAQGASVNVAGDGTLTYDPAGATALQALAPTESLDDTFNYTIGDGNGGSDSATVTVSVSGVNDDPTLANDAATVDEDTADNALEVLGNDTDPENDALTITAVGAPDQGGSAIINGTSDGLLYSPAADFAGTETFTYTADDGNGGSASGTVTVTVNNVNDDPQANADTATVAEDTTGNAIDVLANDSDAPDSGETLTVTAVGTPDQGGAVTNNGTNVSYTPAPDFFGTETFSYTVGDGNGGSDSASVTVTVTNVNDPPVAVDDTGTTDEDTPLNGSGLLGNDTDIDGDSLTSVADSGTTGAGASFQVFTDGTYSYDPNGQFESLDDGESATDSFTYTTIDGNGGSDTATVTITVTGINDAPTLAAVSYATVGNTLLENAVAASGTPAVQVNDPLSVHATDPEGDPVTFSGFTSGTGAAGTVNSDGSFSYTPPPGVSGTADSFTVTLDDGTDTATGTVTVNISADIVWFLDNSGGGSGGTGTSTDPYLTVGDLSAAQGNAGGPATGEVLFVHAGSGTYDGLLTLLNGQELVGEASGLSIAGPPSLSIPADSRPTLTNASGDVVGLAQNNEVRGFDIGDRPSGRGITGNGFGTLTATDVGINGTGQALNLVTGTLSANFNELVSNASTGFGINLDGVGGSLAVSGGTTITDPRGAGVAVNNSGASITLGATSITSAGDAGIPVAGDAVSITANTGTVSFTSLAAGSDNGRAIRAQGGTVNLGGGANTAVATSGAALDLANVDLGSGWSLSSASSTNSTGRGISMTGVSGPVTVAGGSVSGAAGEGFYVSGGNGSVSYSGSIGNASADAVRIENRTGGSVMLSGNITDTGTGVSVLNSAGTVTFSGTSKSLSTGADAAVNLNNNTAAVRFTGGGLDIDTSTGTGFLATSGGTVAVTGAGNTIDSTGASAADIQNTTIATVGAGPSLDASGLLTGDFGMDFVRVSSGGGARGIHLANAGNGGFRITGDGATGSGTSANNDSGGQFTGHTEDGIQLTTTGNVSLDQVRVAGAGRHGINADGVTNLSLQRANLVNNGDAILEHGLRALNTGGEVTVTNTLADGNFDAHFRVFNETGNDLTMFSVDDSVLRNVTSGSFEDGISLEAQTGVTTAIAVTNSTFDNHDGDHVQATSNGSAQMTVDISNNTMTGAVGNLGAGITVNSAGSFSGLTDFTIDTNDIQKANNNSTSININIGGSTASGVYTGTISNNVIGTAGTANSGGNAGIAVEVNQEATMDVLVQNNTVREFFDIGIDVGAVDGSGVMNATLLGNDVSSTSTNAFAALFVDAQTTNTVCADVGDAAGGGNLLDAPNGFSDVALQTGATGLINLDGYGRAADSTADIQLYLQNRNPGSVVSPPSPPVQFNNAGTIQGGGNCPAP